MAEGGRAAKRRLCQVPQRGRASEGSCAAGLLVFLCGLLLGRACGPQQVAVDGADARASEVGGTAHLVSDADAGSELGQDDGGHDPFEVRLGSSRLT